ncbi:MAG: rRNA cytosine-C5-methyltransferase [Alloprevotella sp.]|nr:rRNA cytosine-C5-methyltransferase [Alloprevotella sp.]
MIPLPEDFRAQMRSQLGADEAEALFRALEEEPPVSIRLNPRKCPLPPPPSGGGLEEATSVTLNKGYLEASPGGGRWEGADKVPWCETGRYLSERPQFTLNPLFHAGCYYVQEASSMAVEQACKAIQADASLVTCPSSLRVLDLCAAPGGKSTLWASLLQDALLVCNEPVRQRAQVLAENMAKWGAPDVVVTNAYPADFASLPDFFDIIAADVPCSGEGMFRKDEGARAEWSAENVRMCAARQMDIVRDVWPALRPGGYMVYSTCTFNRLENEDNVRCICEELGAELVPISFLAEGLSFNSGFHFYPHRTRGEGFFIALLRKKSQFPASGEQEASRGEDIKVKKKLSRHKGHLKASPGGGALNGALAQWLRTPEDFQLYTPDDERVYALRRTHFDEATTLFAALRSHVWEPGILLARRKGNKWQPAAPLALSTELAPDAFSRAELSFDDALSYLRRAALVLGTGVPCGYVLVCFEGHPLGFVNNLGSRANNLYPAEWRIRHL